MVLDFRISMSVRTLEIWYNAYELRQTYEHFCDLVNEAELRYPLL